MEAARYGCEILHGPNVSNFTEIYKFLNERKISFKVSNQVQLEKKLEKKLKKKNQSKKIINNLKFIGMDILKKTYKEIY